MTLERFAAGGADIQPHTPLRDPIILWDSRSWDGTLGPGTGGLPNEGTAGSAFDLDVHAIVAPTKTTFAAFQGAGSSAEWTSPGIDWNDLGGPPCDGPFTVMIAMASFPLAADEDLDGTLDCEVLLRAGSGFPVHFSLNTLWSNGTDDDPSGFSTIINGADGVDYPQALYSLESVCPDCTEDYLRQRLLVMTLDGVDGGGTYWRDGVAVSPEIDATPPTIDTSPETFAVTDSSGNCDAGSSDSSISTHELFCYFGDHVCFGELQAGESWNGPIGMVVLRGEPTQADIDFWTDYFFTGYQPWESPLRYTGGTEIRADDDYVYHIFTSSTNAPAGGLQPIAGRTLPTTVDVFQVGGGGQGSNSASVGGRGGAGGGGEVKTTLGHPAPTVATSVIVGNGGFILNSGGFAGDGSQSSFDGLIAAGGRGARFQNGGRNGTAGPLGGTGYIGPTPAVDSAGGGGGGAGGAGGNASAGQGGDAGPGVSNDWRTGSPILYGVGGVGGGQIGTTPGTTAPGGSPAGVEGEDGTGNGASGIIASSAASEGLEGGSGITIIRYARA